MRSNDKEARDDSRIHISTNYTRLLFLSEEVIKSRIDAVPIIIIFDDICITRSYAALRAADQDWIVGPGYSLGRVHSGEKP